MKKKIIGVTEKIVINGISEKGKKVLARIDTGADYSSIDKTIARKIGYAVTIKEFQDRLSVGGEKVQKMKRAEKLEYFTGIPYLKTYFKIKSVHGFSFRPVVDIIIKIKGETIQTTATIIDRSQLKYSVIIGRKDLNGYLIDIN